MDFIEQEESAGAEGNLDANEGGSTSDAASSTPEGASEGGAQDGASQKQETATPFHEHPRFKELVEEKNQWATRYREMEQRFSAFERQMASAQQKPAASQQDKLIEELKQAHPEFAARFEQLSKALPTVETLQERLTRFEQDQVRTTAVNTVNSLHEQNKVDTKTRTWINNQLDLMAMQGQIKSLEDLPRAYSKVHGELKGWLEERDRQAREGYVQAKKADAKVPASQPKGKPATPKTNKLGFSRDPEEARAEVVSRYLKTRAEADSA